MTSPLSKVRNINWSSSQRISSNWIARFFLAIAFAALLSLVEAQDAAPPSDYVSRAEYDKLKTEHEAMKQELDALKATVQQMTAGAVQPPAPGKAVSEGKQIAAAPPEAVTEELRQEVESLKMQVKETFPGTTKFLFGGYGTAGFTARSGEDPFFDVGVRVRR